MHIKKYQQPILYLFFGICTTIVNIITYYLSAHILSLSVILSTCLAWLVSVIFAYITNKWSESGHTGIFIIYGLPIIHRRL